MQEMLVGSLGQEDPLEEGMATHSSVLAWRIPRTEETGELQSVGSQWVGHDWSNWVHAHMYVFIRYYELLKTQSPGFKFAPLIPLTRVRPCSPWADRTLRSLQGPASWTFTSRFVQFALTPSYLPAWPLIIHVMRDSSSVKAGKSWGFITQESKANGNLPMNMMILSAWVHYRKFTFSAVNMLDHRAEWGFLARVRHPLRLPWQPWWKF